MRRVLLVAMLLLAVVVGCKDREGDVVTPTTTLDVALTELAISHEAQRVEIEVVCNEEFDVREEVFWLAVTNVLEGDTKVVVLNVLANDSVESRSADVVISVGELQHTVTIVQSGMPTVSMEVAITHRNASMVSPKWCGEAVSGSIDWGDDSVEEYVEGATHDYADMESHTAIFTMSGATSFEIERIGDMESLTIAMD